MDWKERLLLLFPLLGILVSVGLLMIGFVRWRTCGIVIVGMAVGVFVAVQPFRDGEYESCGIYFEEIEGLIEGKMGKGVLCTDFWGGEECDAEE